MLAIVTQNPWAVAETYVRQHMRLVAPGRTVAIGLASKPNGEPIVPTLSLTPTTGKIQSFVNFLKAGYAGAVTGRNARLAEQFLDRHGVKAVLAEFGPTGCAMAQFCNDRAIPIFVYFYGYDATVMPQRASVRYAYRRLAKQATGTICLSRHFKQKLVGLGFPAERIWVIPSGIELEHFSVSTARDPNLVVAIGRLTAKKAPDITIRAFALARRQLPDLRLEIVGGGPQMEACQKAIEELDLGECVILHGAQDHDFVSRTLARASLFVQHSVTAPNGDEESQGISLIEAMATGIPVVTTRHNGFPETVLDGETGLLSEEHDVEAMGANIARLMQSPGLREAFGKAGRERVERHFDAQQLSHQLHDLVLGASRENRQ